MDVHEDSTAQAARQRDDTRRAKRPSSDLQQWMSGAADTHNHPATICVWAARLITKRRFRDIVNEADVQSGLQKLGIALGTKVGTIGA